MGYRYLEDVATADVAFLAWGHTLEETFAASADATMNVMVEDLATITGIQRFSVILENEALDLLLFSFLNELVFYKDARRLLLRASGLTITHEDCSFKLKANLYGEEIDPSKHPLRVDVKAVTLHLFELREIKDGWEALIVLDI
jgi:SHS2 domain-containing protein